MYGKTWTMNTDELKQISQNHGNIRYAPFFSGHSHKPKYLSRLDEYHNKKMDVSDHKIIHNIIYALDSQALTFYLPNRDTENHMTITKII